MNSGTHHFGLQRVGQIAIPVRDVEKAKNFYRDALGMKFLFSAPPGLAFFECGGVRLMLDSSVEENAGKGSAMYYTVDDIQAAYGMLQQRNVHFEREPHRVARMPDHELWMAFFRDPDGNLLALMSEVR